MTVTGIAGDDGTATSAPFTPTVAGTYCFRAQYTPATGAPYSPAHHTNLTTECFVAKAAPGLTTQASGTVIPSGTVTDTATLTQTGQLGTVNGTVAFFVCGPASSAPDCSSGGFQVGAAVTVTGGSATSSAFTPPSGGFYCFRAVYTPASGSNYLTTSHTNQSTTAPNNECFAYGVGSIKATKYNDRNGNGSRAATGEEGLSGWRIFIDTNGDSSYESGTDISPALTDSNGEVVFSNLTPATYQVCEVGQAPGWANTDPADGSRCKNVTVAAGAQTAVALGNQTRGTISGRKFNDVDGDGVFDAGEPNLAGWTIRLCAVASCDATGDPIQTDVTDGGGYSFSGLTAGTYYVCEVLQSGWQQNSPAGCHSIVIAADSPTNAIDRNFGNASADVDVVKTGPATVTAGEPSRGTSW